MNKLLSLTALTLLTIGTGVYAQSAAGQLPPGVGMPKVGSGLPPQFGPLGPVQGGYQYTGNMTQAQRDQLLREHQRRQPRAISQADFINELLNTTGPVSGIAVKLPDKAIRALQQVGISQNVTLLYQGAAPKLNRITTLSLPAQGNVQGYTVLTTPNSVLYHYGERYAVVNDPTLAQQVRTQLSDIARYAR